MKLLFLWKAIVALTSVAEAQRLAFITPNGGDPTQYTEGQDVQIRWTTPFQLTNVEVWQGPRQDGSYSTRSLRANCTPDQTSLSWRAGSLSGEDFQHGLLFRLQKSDEPNLCAACVAVSQQFRVKQVPRLVADPVTVKVQSDTPANAQVSATTDSNASKSPGVSLKAEIGVALGIGLAGAAAIMIFCVLWWRKKYLHKKGLKEAQQHGLGDARQVPMELEEKLQYNLYQSSVRASYTTTGTAASGKAPSYFDPFEFEDEDGRIREGWYSLWADGRPSRMSNVPLGSSLMRKSILAQPGQTF
ncbi:hypothetical protein AC579_2991 [Pseudocercospora musae]|uniref:Mid2 domain-containing protein n=1 Tax=Pseudocercospora musae TaxID=113226 RepID=A0A139I0Z9_9PEZI|nr:hypothetical protein AC579_2991 [Pseudocercospora musae]KXT08378.1 hypothetical protein AC579_2991 [Pseudocercospora musae]